MRRLFALFVVVGSLTIGPASSASASAEGETVARPSHSSVTSPGVLVRLPIHAQPNGRYWS